MARVTKTPLRYPGGKSRMAQYLWNFFPPDTDWDYYVEPFVGGASMFFYVKQRCGDKSFWINDLHGDLVNFWRVLQNNSAELRGQILLLRARYPDPVTGRILFERSLEVLGAGEGNDLERAALYYAANKLSFSGLTQKSYYAPQAYAQNFTLSCINALPNFGRLLQGVRITNLDYREVLNSLPRAMWYFDPPYAIGDTLYGTRSNDLHGGFDHEAFRDAVTGVAGKWMVSYNDSSYIRSLWRGHSLDDGYRGKYTLNCPRNGDSKVKRSKGSSEIVISNYSGLAPVSPRLF